MLTVEEFERSSLYPVVKFANLFVKIKIQHYGYHGEMVIAIQNKYKTTDRFYDFVVNHLDMKKELKYSLDFEENIKHCIHLSEVPNMEYDDKEENVRFKKFGGIRIFNKDGKSAYFGMWQFLKYITGFEILGFEEVELEDEKEN